MQRLGDNLHYSPSDLNHFVECEHLTSLDLLAVSGRGSVKRRTPTPISFAAKASNTSSGG